MIIRSISYQNFRNFGKQGKVEFDTTGKVSIVYGRNGVGKTTFHQLFQWILYNRIKFNNTTSDDKLYNLKKGEELKPGYSLVVWGEIEFEHDGELYSVRREREYKKNYSGQLYHDKSKDSFCVQKRDRNNDWKEVADSSVLIESVLPSALSPYFFFDGETMIADLKVRGTDSAKKLASALYSIFNLNAYEQAVKDIGNTNKSSTILGTLEREKNEVLSKMSKNGEQKENLRMIKILERQSEKLADRIEELNDEEKVITNRLTEIAVEIAKGQSKIELERERKSYKESIERKEAEIKREKLRFGKEIDENFSYLLITEVVKSADERLYLQVQEEKGNIIPGLQKELLLNLIDKNGGKCLCGNCISNTSIEYFKRLLSFFPPASYKSTYDRFRHAAEKYSGNYDPDNIKKYVNDIISIKNDIRKDEDRIDDIDEQLKQIFNIDELIDERKELEQKLIELKKEISKQTAFKGDNDHQLELRKSKVQKIESATGEMERIEQQICFVKNVLSRVESILKENIENYSKELQESIQSLVNTMLTSKREVTLSDGFELRVVDSYNDESKSEGQFAVVSFAYIGGIFSVIQKNNSLRSKQFPLVLDGPFSKLDPEQRDNVISTIPAYAPQVIIFSKDSLEEYIPDKSIGKRWTIVSNGEKNDSEIKEGFLWN